MGAGIAIAVVLSLITAGGIGYAAVETGYLPVKDFMGFSTLDVKAPAGNYTVLPINNISSQYPVVDEILCEMPHINDIKYTVYETSASMQEAMNAYHAVLLNEGYGLKYNGSIMILGTPFHYYGYVKGLTVVGIVITNGMIGHDTLVVYTTGHGTYYKDHILPWLTDKKLEL